jgi:ATP-dependent Clp protease ATP-binding subunit ClpC
VFERYNESARRALFFSRYELAQLGGVEIGTEHLLLGLMLESKGLVGQILAPLASETIRNEIKSRSSSGEKLATSVEVPFTREAKRALHFAMEEADRLLHSYIGPEHLILGLLREEKSAAATILNAHGLRLADVRSRVAQPPGHTPNTSMATRPQILEQIEQIEHLVQELGADSKDLDHAHVLVVRICAELDTLRQHFDKP